MRNPELKARWEAVLADVSQRFGGGEELDIDAILFLIGVQELGQGYRKFTKDQKMDLMHIAICRLLSAYGYYVFTGRDSDGWPHWEATEQLPFLKAGEQSLLIKEAIVLYFDSYSEGL